MFDIAPAPPDSPAGAPRPNSRTLRRSASPPHDAIPPRHKRLGFLARISLNIYHDYNPTPGCGGFSLGVTLHNVRNQPGYTAGLGSTDNSFTAFADTARTFGCLRPDGTFDHSTSFVVRTEQQELLPVYYETDANWVLSELRKYPTWDVGPYFYMNFPAVTVNCPTGMTPAQYGLKVTDVNITIADDNVFGHTTWSTPGPFYG